MEATHVKYALEKTYKVVQIQYITRKTKANFDLVLCAAVLDEASRYCVFFSPGKDIFRFLNLAECVKVMGREIKRKTFILALSSPLFNFTKAVS